MTAPRQSVPGATRKCPHCRETILDSAAVCPACRKHLRFEARPTAGPKPVEADFSAFRVEGTIVHPDVGEAWEYSVFASIRNDRGEEIDRKVIGVGALKPSERRMFTVGVEVFKPVKK
jgi:hypothetical protein